VKKLTPFVCAGFQGTVVGLALLTLLTMAGALVLLLCASCLGQASDKRRSIAFSATAVLLLSCTIYV
jgi:hypothetical protein